MLYTKQFLTAFIDIRRKMFSDCKRELDSAEIRLSEEEMNKSFPSGYQACTWRLETVGVWGKSPKRRGLRLGCGEKGAANSSQRRRFLPPFHRYIDNMSN